MSKRSINNDGANNEESVTDMARPLSEEKREAILEAAAATVATLGMAAPTSKIAKAAGVAEGTLFTYFTTKDVLLNALYLEIKADMRSTLPDDLSLNDDPQTVIRALWDGLIDWNIDNGTKAKAMRQLAVSDIITAASRAEGSAPFRDVEAMFANMVSKSALRDLSPAFAGAVLQNLAETVTQFIAQEPDQRDHYKRIGFAMLWSAINMT